MIARRLAEAALCLAATAVAAALLLLYDRELAVAVAVAVGLVGNAVGFVLALAINQPPGPVLVLSSGVLTLVSFLVPQRPRATAAPAPAVH